MKQVVKIMLAAAVVVALAVPAMAADKLIVKNIGGGTAFKVDDAGKITVRNAGDTADAISMDNTGQLYMAGAGGTSNGATFKDVSTTNNFTSVAAVPDGTAANQGVALQVIPRGTGFSATIKSQFVVFNTDLNADMVNYESIVLKAGGTKYTIGVVKGGTGALRPLIFEMGNNQAKLTVDTTGYVGIGTTTPSSVLSVVGLPTYASNAAAIGGGLTVGAFYKTATGAVMVVY